MSRFSKIEVTSHHQGQVLTLTLASGRGNVLDREMILELTEAVQSEARRPDVKALVFQGKGEHFCYGASVLEHRRKHAAQMLTGFHNLLRSMIDLSKPGVALVRGRCLGGGLELAWFLPVDICCRRRQLWPTRDRAGGVPPGRIPHSALAGGPTGS